MTQLEELQRRLLNVLMTPLSRGGRLRATTLGGARIEAEARGIIQPGNRLSPAERLEIYSRSYWFRLLDSLQEDFPGLHAILGPAAFRCLAQTYLGGNPSCSFTLRNLGSRLPAFLAQHPQPTAQITAVALDMARLEWAHIEAFDGLQRAPLGPEDLLELDQSPRLALQPHLSLLPMVYPVDDARIEIEHAPEQQAVAVARRLRRRSRTWSPESLYVAVYRGPDGVYYRRLQPPEFEILRHLQSGVRLDESLAAATGCEVNDVQDWFSAWSRLGWLCRHEDEPTPTRRNSSYEGSCD